MSQQPTITITGNAGDEPKVGVTKEGKTWARFTVAVTPRRFDEATQEWVNGDASWYTVWTFNQLGEHCADTIKKGDRVVVVGRLKVEEYEQDGQKRVSVSITADDVGRSLLFSDKPRVAAHAAPVDDVPPF